VLYICCSLLKERREMCFKKEYDAKFKEFQDRLVANEKLGLDMPKSIKVEYSKMLRELFKGMVEEEYKEESEKIERDLEVQNINDKVDELERKVELMLDEIDYLLEQLPE